MKGYHCASFPRACTLHIALQPCNWNWKNPMPVLNNVDIYDLTYLPTHDCTAERRKKKFKINNIFNKNPVYLWVFLIIILLRPYPSPGQMIPDCMGQGKIVVSGRWNITIFDKRVMQMLIESFFDVRHALYLSNPSDTNLLASVLITLGNGSHVEPVNFSDKEPEFNNSAFSVLSTVLSQGRRTEGHGNQPRSHDWHRRTKMASKHMGGKKHLSTPKRKKPKKKNDQLKGDQGNQCVTEELSLQNILQLGGDQVSPLMWCWKLGIEWLQCFLSPLNI